MKKRTIWKKFGDFLEGKGFYIVLFLCVAAIGGSGYYLYRMVSLSEQMPSQSVSAKAEVPASTGKQDDVEVVLDGEGDTKTAANQTTGTTQEELPTTKAEGDEDLEAKASKNASSQTNQSKRTESTATQSEDSAAVTTSASNSWNWPLEGEVAEAFSTETLSYNEAMGDWRTHTGVDIAAKVGDTVTAAIEGTVISVKDDVMLGKTVTVQTSGKLNTIYGNLADKVSVTSGDKIQAGQTIGMVGETASGEKHDTAWLHFAVEQDGKALDPMQYLQKQTMKIQDDQKTTQSK